MASEIIVCHKTGEVFTYTISELIISQMVKEPNDISLLYPNVTELRGQRTVYFMRQPVWLLITTIRVTGKSWVKYNKDY